MFIKFIATITLFCQIAFFGYIPYIWSDIGHNKRIMSLVGCFASGLFLALAFLHILPQANEELSHAFNIDQQNTQSHQHLIPWGSVICIFTFISVLTIQVLVQRYLKSKSISENLETLNHRSSSSSNLERLSYNKSNISSVILIQLALSIHSFIECLALGSQSNGAAAFTLFVGIGCHKWAEGLTLGFTYKKANFSSRLASYFCFFHACLNGGAVIIGWILSAESSQVVSGSLGAVSAGTFLYISTVEKIPHQFHNTKVVGQKIFAIVIGVIFVCLIV